MSASSQLAEWKTDVLVVGGGPAGSAFAMTAVEHGLSVVVAERSHYESHRVGEHLPPDAQPILHTMGVNILNASCYSPCPGTSSFWGSEQVLEQDYLFNPYGPGQNLDRAQFDAVLVRAAEKSGAVVLTDVRLANLSFRNNSWTACLKGGDGKSHTVSSRFLVDATGRSAAVSRRLGSDRLVQDKLVALCAWLPSPGPLPCGGRLLIEAVESGWWYAASLPLQRCVAVFLCDHDLLPSGTTESITEWTRQLGRTHHVKALLQGCGPPAAFLLRAANSYILNRITGEGWLAVGDAAAAFDPLSSMGILKALRGGISAANIVARSLAGDRGALGEYSQEVTRQFHQYLREWQFFYSHEGRWPEGPFWRRRRVSVTGIHKTTADSPALERLLSLH